MAAAMEAGARAAPSWSSCLSVGVGGHLTRTTRKKENKKRASKQPRRRTTAIDCLCFAFALPCSPLFHSSVSGRLLAARIEA